MDRDIIADGYEAILLPKGETAETGTGAKRFGAFEPGDYVMISCDVDFHIDTGDGTVTATTSSPKWVAGVYRAALPDGSTHVSILGADGESIVGSVYKSQLP